MTAPARWHRPVLLLLTLLTWANAVHGAAVNYDDPWLVLANPVLRPPRLDAWLPIWTDLSTGVRFELGAEFLPVRDMTVWLDFLLFGDDLRGHHLQNVAWYAAGVLLLHAVFLRLLRHPGRALAAAAVFATLPVHAESVAWLASRKDVVGLAFVAATTLLGLGGSPASGPLALLAMWAKSTSVVLPVWLARAGAPVRTWLAVGVAAAGATALAMYVGRDLGLFAERYAATPLQWLGVQGNLTARYVTALLWPPSLSLRYPDPGLGLSWGHLPWLAFVVLAFRRGPVGVGAAWFLLALLPVSQLLPLQNLVADRYLLLPSAGVCLLLGALLPAERAAALGLVLAVFQAPFAWRRCEVWHDSVDLWADAVAKTPSDPELRVSLAGALSARGRPGDAAEEAGVLREARAAFPASGEVRAAIAIRQMKAGDVAEAEAGLLAALRLAPTNRSALNNLVVLRVHAGRASEALPLCERLVAANPNYAEGWNTCGTAWLEVRDLPKARRAFREALRVFPADPNAPCNLGGVEYLAGERDAAVRAWTACLARDPANTQALGGLHALGAR